MNISDTIKVDTFYTRSINIERDSNTESVLNAYIPTTRSLKTLERIATTFHEDQAPRSWALVGPYGSGKSAFAVFLTHLLGTSGSPANKTALKKLRASDKKLATHYKQYLRGRDAYCQVLLTGGPEPFCKALITKLAAAAEMFWQNKRGKKPLVIKELKKASQTELLTPSDVLQLIQTLQQAVNKSGGRGLLILVDELGKFLEYEARHYGQNDIFLLQMLAEHCQSKHSSPIHLVVLLHQSFEQYAKGLGEALRNEWSKIQGRFETVPFLESTEQTLRVVSTAIQTKFDSGSAVAIQKKVATQIKALEKSDALPKAFTDKDAIELFTGCYPLHPLTSLLLPSLCQKVAQNERTLFSYLGSHEPNGFMDSIARLEKLGDWVMPHELYDYFVQNQPMAAIEQLAMRRWAEIETAVQRLGDAPDAEINMVKTIGLLNLIGAQGQFRASKQLLELCFRNKKTAGEILKSLQQSSIIQFRRYSNEYRVWQGSDIDLDDAVTEAIGEIGQFRLAETLTKRQTLEPLVARRHSIETGHLRYVEATFSDWQTLDKQSDDYDQAQLELVDVQHTYNPKLFIYLAEGQEDLDQFLEFCKSDSNSDNVVGICPLGPQLRQAVADVLALEHIQNNNQDLSRDPVALRELQDRLVAAQLVESELVNSILEHPEESTWYWKGKPLTHTDHHINNKRMFQAALSEVMSEVYCSSPIVRNELINRDKPSAQANAARNKLLDALINQSEKETLGIEKNPPEKAIYDAIFKESGLHNKVKGEWVYKDPTTNDKLNFNPFLKEIYRYYEGSESAPRSFDELTEILVSPPYGLKRGLLPIIYVFTFLRHQNDLALYENRIYIPYLTFEIIERFVKRPQDFTVQRFQIKGLRRSIFQEYSSALFEDGSNVKDIISIARPLARFMTELPEYTQQTKRVSSKAQEVRNAFKLAKSPQTLLFELIPTACGYGGGKSNKGFSEVLVELLRELKYALPNLQTELQDLFKSGFRLEMDAPIGKMRAILAGRFEGLEDYTIDTEGLRAFINRIINSDGGDEKWFKNVLLFLGRKPIDKWTDIDRDAAELRLAEFSRRINDLERLRVHYDGVDATGIDFEVLLLKTGSKQSGEKDEIVVLNEEMKAVIQNAIESMNKIVATIPEDNLRLAAIASVADQFLTKHRESKKDIPLLKPQEVANE